MRDESALRGLVARTQRPPVGSGEAVSGLARARQLALVLWLAVSSINFVVWIAVSIGSASWDTPWWLYGFGIGGVLVGALTLAERTVGRPHAASDRHDW